MIDDKIRTFVEVVECQNYTQAAKNLHLTQPAVSQQIKALENHYQQVFIDHTQKFFSLTTAGQLLYQYAKSQIHNEILFEKQLASCLPPLKIGSTLSIADYYIPDMIANTFLKAEKNCEIVVANTHTLIQKMMDGEIECAFVEGQFDTLLFEHHLFKEEHFIAVANPQHPLSQHPIPFDQLFSYPILIRERGSGTREILENYLDQTIYNLSHFAFTMEIGSLSMIKTLLMESNAISFLYAGVVKNEILNQQLVQLNIQNFQMIHPMHFIYLKSNIQKDFYKQLFYSMIQPKE